MSDKDATERWKTSITEIQTDVIRYRGYSVSELIGNASYAGVVYLMITGELPTASQERVLDAILVSSVDHGATPPSTLAARTAASTGAPLNAALAAGLLSINGYHGGAIEACMKTLERLAAAENDHGTRVEAAETVVIAARTEEARLSGFGHRVHKNDPRARRLLDLSVEEGLAGAWIDRLTTLEGKLEEQSGRKLPINVDGAIAAILKELLIKSEAANALFMIARLPGLLAHVLEERETQRPMRRIQPGSAEYVGPAERTLDTDGLDER